MGSEIWEQFFSDEKLNLKEGAKSRSTEENGNGGENKEKVQKPDPNQITKITNNLKGSKFSELKKG